MWSHVRGWAAAAGVLASVLPATACHVTPTPAPSATASATASAPASAAATAPAPAGSPDPAKTPAAPVVPAGPVVALGDSYTAGALLPLQPNAAPVGCGRSAKAYPVLVARALHAPLTSVACVSAGIKDMTAAQRTYGGTNPAQLSALTPDDGVVLLTLGGDDMGFMNVLRECMGLSFTRPYGTPCQAHYTTGGTDQLAAKVSALRPQVTQVLSAITARAPRARVVLVGYPDLFPQSGGCWPAVPITNGDIAYLRRIEVMANAVLAAGAKAAGVTFVNTYAATAGHDFCKPEPVKEIEGLVPGSLALPFHPNARGQAAMAAAVLAALNG